MNEKGIKKLNELEESEVVTALAEFNLKIPKDLARMLNRYPLQRRKTNQPWGWKRGRKVIHSKRTKGRIEMTIIHDTTGEI